MLTLNLSFKSLPFLSTQFVSCELPITPLVFVPSLSRYKFCPNSILCCVSICYHHYLVIHRPWLDTYLYSCSLKFPLFHLKSSNLPIWPLDEPSPFFICRSCLNSILYGTYILCSYAHLPPLLHSCMLSPLSLVISIHLHSCLLWTYPLKPPLFNPCLRIMPHLLHH
jgi:hypothetical protein